MSAPPLFPPLQAAPALGARVWIVSSFSGKPTPRYYHGGAIDRPLLGMAADSSAGAVIHCGPVWDRQSGALEHLLDAARARRDRAQDEVDALAAEKAACND